MPKIAIDTKKSLYKPIEVEIDGKVFKVRRIERSIFNKIDALSAEALKGDVDAGYKQLELLIGKSDIVNNLDIREVSEIINFVTEQLIKPEKSATTEEKNESKPGSTK